MYDEDNVDLEEQLYLQEVQEELDAEEAALEELEEDEEYDPTDYTLTKSFLKENYEIQGKAYIKYECDNGTPINSFAGL